MGNGVRLRFVSDGKIKGWVWLNLFSAAYLLTILGILLSDNVAHRVKECIVVVTVGLPSVLAAHSYTKKDSITARAVSVLPGKCEKPDEKEDP